MNKQSFKYFIPIIVIIAACSGRQVKQPESAAPEAMPEQVILSDEQYRNAGIQTGKVEMHNISATIQASGLLDVPPQSKVSITAPMGGFVKETSMLQGTHIRKGEVVAIMQHPDFIQLQQDYLDHISQLEYLREEYHRQQELAAENINARKTLQQSKAAYLSMEARVKGSRARLNMLNVDPATLEKGELQQVIKLYAPITGYVTRVNVNIGAYVNPTDVMFEIVNTEHLHAELTVFEKDVPKVEIGQKVQFILANESKPRKATVYLVGREISKDRSVQVHCHLDDEDRQLLPGTYLRAWVETGNVYVPALPAEAIINSEGKDVVFVDAGKTPGGHLFKQVIVKKGNTEMGFTEVSLPDSIARTARVVTQGAYELLAEMKNRGEAE